MNRQVKSIGPSKRETVLLTSFSTFGLNTLYIDAVNMRKRGDFYTVGGHVWTKRKVRGCSCVRPLTEAYRCEWIAESINDRT